MMPKLHWFFVFQTCKNEFQLQNTYIIILTSKGQEFDLQKGKEAGADLYITKPFDPDEVVERSQEILGLN
jgi:DNA-binding response OmpR family regulator